MRELRIYTGCLGREKKLERWVATAVILAVTTLLPMAASESLACPFPSAPTLAKNYARLFRSALYLTPIPLNVIINECTQLTAAACSSPPVVAR